MAKRTKRPELKREFYPKKGEVRNPKGAGGKDRAASVLRKFGRKDLTKILDLVLTCNLKELERIAESQDRTALTIGIARALERAVRCGNWKTLESIVSRIIGNTPIRIDHTSDGKPMPTNAPAVVTLYMPKNGRTKEEVQAANAGNEVNDDGYDLGF